MQTKDLRVGTAYAYKYAKWATPEKVILLEAKADETVKEGYRTFRKVGAKVRLNKGGEVRIVQPREIVSTWDEHVEHERKAAEYKAAQAQHRDEFLTKRAAQAFALSERLLEMGWSERAGERAGVGYCYNSEVKPYLKAAGFKPAGEASHYRSAFYALDDVVRRGSVPLEAALALAGQFETQEV